MIATLLTMAAPLALAGLGGLLTELSGSLGIFLEGFMTLGSFFAWTATKATGSMFLGCAAAALPSALAGWLLARFARAFGANLFIVALALNLAAGGLVEALSATWYGTKGVLADPAVPASHPAVFIALSALATAATAIFVSRTRQGLRLRAAGRDAEALRERGVDPDSYRAGAWAAAAALAALAGAALTFRVGAYAPGGVAGRGWIALVVVYLGFRNAWGVAAASLAFAGAEFAGAIAQGTGTVPSTLLLGLPSALALLLFSLSSILRSRRRG
jgi:simple sugar transport system permease protein